MRHLKKGRKFGRETGQRRALLRALAVSLISHGKIRTTEPKAKELRPYVERMVTYAKIGSVGKRRLALAEIGETAVKKLFEVYGEKYKNREGGYVRIVKMPSRIRDAAPQAVIEFV